MPHPGSTHRRCWVPAGLVMATAACQAQTQGGLEVAYSGCAEVYAGPACARPESGELVLSVAGVAAPALKVEVDGRPIPGHEVLSPRRPDLGPDLSVLRVRLPTPASQLSVRTESRNWTLALAPGQPSDPLVAAARRELENGDAAAATQTLLAGFAHLAPAHQASALAQLARSERVAGHYDAAMEYAQRAYEAFRTAGALWGQVDSATITAYLLVQHGRRFAEARRLLDAVAPLLPRHALAQFLVSYNRGLIASHTGQVRTALRELEQASHWASRMDDDRRRDYADQIRARVMRTIGQHEQAAAILERIQRDAAHQPPCSRYLALLNHGWGLLIAREAAQDPARWSAQPARSTDPVPVLQEALRLVRTTCHQYPQQEANLLVNLALAAVQNGDNAAAQRNLAAARAQGLPMKSLEALWATDIEARLAMSEGDAAAALRLFETLEQQAKPGLALGAEWRALVGQALAHDHLGQGGQARADFARAEQRLVDQSLAVPSHDGRSGFLAQRARATRQWLAALLRRQRPAEAFAALRRSRARLLQTLQWQQHVDGMAPVARTAWEIALGDYRRNRQRLEEMAAELVLLPRDEVAAAQAAVNEQTERTRTALDHAMAAVSVPATTARPATVVSPAGDLVLGVARVEAGFVGFAELDGEVDVQPLGDLRPETMSAAALSQALLHPFAAELGRARRLRLAPGGALAQVDWHALPWGKAPLLAHLPIVYGVDLPPPSRVPPRQRGALIVADPTCDLPAARREGRRVAAQLQQQGLAGPIRLLVGAEATRQAVQAALSEGVLLFHYAGHASYDSRQSWSGLLRLAQHSHLRVSDVLSLRRAPRHVVLSACGTPDAAAEPISTVGLGQAFVAGGTQTVLLTTRPVRDKLAERISTLLYASAIYDWPTRVRNTVRDAARQLPQEDWASYRLLVP